MERVDDEDTENEAEKEPLTFDLDLSTLDPKVGEVMIKIKELAEEVLYHWSIFPFHLPPSITDSYPTTVEDNEQQGIVSFGDLFMAPNFDELEEVAMDKKGQPKWLTNKQLEDVRQKGEFEVESNHFPGQVHRWRLSLLLQKGTRRAHSTLLDVRKSVDIYLFVYRMTPKHL